MKHYIAQLADGFGWKAVLSIGGTIVSAIEGFYSPLIWGFLLLFLLDLVTGISKSLKNGVPITSSRLRNSVVKLGGYMVLLTALVILSKYQAEVVPMITLAYYYFMFTEVKSIFENVQEMGVKLPGFLNTFAEGKLKDLDAGGSSKEETIVHTKEETIIHVKEEVKDADSDK